ncbi:hypothetical protein [Zoogloea sp.]|uniref:hypothetical protein n=1 Tax=Zoogloea sp. TaxID=49181 RepID=UPI0035B409D5
MRRITTPHALTLLTTTTALNDRHADAWHRRRSTPASLEETGPTRCCQPGAWKHRRLLGAHGFEVLDFVPEDPACGFHSIWLARRLT